VRAGRRRIVFGSARKGIRRLHGGPGRIAPAKLEFTKGAQSADWLTSGAGSYRTKKKRNSEKPASGLLCQRAKRRRRRVGRKELLSGDTYDKRAVDMQHQPARGRPKIDEECKPHNPKRCTSSGRKRKEHDVVQGPTSESYKKDCPTQFVERDAAEVVEHAFERAVNRVRREPQKRVRETSIVRGP